MPASLITTSRRKTRKAANLVTSVFALSAHTEETVLVRSRTIFLKDRTYGRSCNRDSNVFRRVDASERFSSK
jgi:hypothetical protein